jgi:hypothetical protein
LSDPPRLDWYGIGGGAVRPSRPRLDHILPALVVGEYPNIDDVPWLRDAHAITAVVCLQDEADLASKRLRLRALHAAYAEARIAFDILIGETHDDPRRAAGHQARKGASRRVFEDIMGGLAFTFSDDSVGSG